MTSRYDESLRLYNVNGKLEEENLVDRGVLAHYLYLSGAGILDRVVNGLYGFTKPDTEEKLAYVAGPGWDRE